MDDPVIAEINEQMPRSHGNTLVHMRRLHAFIDARRLRAVGRHHEIYLRDPRRTAPERLQTIIRQPVVA